MSFKHAPRFAALALALSAALGGSLVASPALAAGQAKAAVSLPYESFTLPNGLRVVVHTDRKAPIVAVNIWYHVGSKDEPAGRTGFAHLFEHLMFNGSENHPGEYFAPFEQAGATDMNGTTNSDRTNYFQNVPTTALDMALWMESDRMGHLLGAIDQKTLDEQRGVVQNEKRQGENRPYGQFYATMLRTMYPKSHPYHHTVIGSMNDLNAATLDDVKNWFRAWYGPNNAVLVLAGDIDVATAREKVTKYFGHIPAGPSLAQPAVNVPKMNVSGRTEMQDKVPQTLLARVWNVPQSTSSESDVLDLFSEVLGGSTTSRLDRRLVYQDQLVDSISTSNMGSQLAGLFMVQAMVKPGVDVAKVEAAIDEELQKLLREGPSAEELARAKTDHNASLVRGMERIGGFGGKADILASCTIYTGKPGCLDESQRTIAAATPASVQQTAQRWLAAPSHTFVITPGERTALTEDLSVQPAPFNLPAPDRKYRTTAAQVDRSQGVPQVTDFPALKFPALQRAKLANGTTVVLAERHDIPVVQMSYQFHGGYASDAGGKLGRASFAMGMLDEGAGELDALAFKARAESLGAQLGAGANLDGSSVSLSALKSNLDASLALYADMLRRPAFNAADIERVRAQWLAGIAQEKANPGSVAQRVLPPLLYGEGHPYAIPFTGSGTEDAIKALSRDDLLAYQKTWLRPEAATLLVVGDTTLEEIVPLLNKHLGDWKGEGAVAQPVALPQVDAPRQARVYLIDQPGAIQANIMVGKLVPSSRDAGATRLEMSNDIIGGTFTSRLNMNLREDKHWSYGARTSLVSALGQRPWLASAPVQIDKTAESLAEIRREFAEYASGKAPARQEEVTKVVNNELRSQPGAYETGRAVMSTINGIVRYGRPDNWVTLRNAEVEAFSVADANTAAASFNPDNLVWVVVGDLGKIEAPVRALNLGEVTILDADGKPVAAKK